MIFWANYSGWLRIQMRDLKGASSAVFWLISARSGGK